MNENNPPDIKYWHPDVARRLPRTSALYTNPFMLLKFDMLWRRLCCPWTLRIKYPLIKIACGAIPESQGRR